MSLISSIRHLDKRFAWSFLGVLLASIFGGITLYTEFYRDNYPSFNIEIISNTRVLDLKADVEELKIYYKDVDIKSLNQTLSLVELRVRNTGRAPILNGYYDKRYPVRIVLDEGKFLKADQVSHTNDYLATSAFPIIKSDTLIEFPEVILEPGEGYTIKVMALHSLQSGISLGVAGKIANVREIFLHEAKPDDREISYWGDVLSGDVFIQLGRLPTYFLGFILLLVLLFAPPVIASDALLKKKRRRMVEQYKSYAEREFNDTPGIIFETFIENGLERINDLKKVLADEEKLNSVIRNGESEHPEDRLPEEDDMTDGLDANGASLLVYMRRDRREKIWPLIKALNVALPEEDGSKERNSETEKRLNKFFEFISIKNT